MKTTLVYQGKYGATEQYAKWLAEELLVPAISAENCGLDELEDNDLLIMGSSVYIGKLQLSKWLRTNELKLERLRLILFVVSGTPLDETVKLLTYVKKSMPPALFEHCRIFFMPGRLIYNKLSKRDRFMLRIGALFAGRKAGEHMLTGYDDVRKEHLQEAISYIRTLQESVSGMGSDRAPVRM